MIQGDLHASGLFYMLRPRVPNTDSMMIDMRLYRGHLWIRRPCADTWCCTGLTLLHEIESAVRDHGAEEFIARCEAMEADWQSPD